MDKSSIISSNVDVLSDHGGEEAAAKSYSVSADTESQSDTILMIKHSSGTLKLLKSIQFIGLTAEYLCSAFRRLETC